MSTPEPRFGRRRRSRWRGPVIEATAIVFILVISNVAGTLIALGLAGKIARHCALELEKVLR